MIICNNGLFVLNTDNTTYSFRVMETGHLEHLYYGEKIDMGLDAEAALAAKHECPGGNLISYSDEYNNITLENIPVEISSYGKGDVREPSVVVEYSNGSMTSDFVYDSYEIKNGHSDLKGLPSAYVESENKSESEENISEENTEVQQLTIRLKEKVSGIKLEIVYTAFEKSDCITRSAKLTNSLEEKVILHRLMSCHLEFSDSDYNFINFTGGWAREMDMNVVPCINGKIVNSSKTGTSSSRCNPFVMIAGSEASENYGRCYGFNLIYSGNHYECAEVGSYDMLRFVSGINPDGFEYEIAAGETFQAPEAVVTYSSKGFNGMSHNMHSFVRNHIVRGEWKYKERPVLLNSWEACYFKFDESKLIKLAKKASAAGIELFVMDDGWFGKRDNDNSSLGDWTCNTKKLPNGLKGIADKINGLGMKFGIWVEPEMVNEDSECFRNHPDWAVRSASGDLKNHSKGRNQMLLDLTLEPVRKYIVSSMSNVFSSADISYVKWDMNRIFSDEFSAGLNNQKEFAHRYVLGLYEILNELTKKFPHILFEACASGGNRFDLGMLCYMPQIWASDNTDAWCRAGIQLGYSYGYPMSVIGAHVSSCPNHQTLRNTPLETRFNIALSGCLGYELNLNELPQEEFDMVKKQIEFYKKYRSILFSGDFYRVKCNSHNLSMFSGSTGVVNAHNLRGSLEYQWTVVSKDKEKAIGVQIHNMAVPNMPFARFRAAGLKDEKEYHFYNRKLKYNIKDFGDLVNTVAPIHIRKDSIIHNTVARFVKLDGETEEYKVKGSLLNNAGIQLKENYSATGYNSEVRYYQDYASRVYVME